MDLSGHGEIPIPITTNYAGIHDTPLLHHTPNGPAPLSTEEHHPNNSITPYSSKKVVVVFKYKECLKNHAASIGGIATDGCGEFMPSGEEGTLEALKCSACSCHRNFHRKESGGEASPCNCFHHFKGRKREFLITGPHAFGYGHGGSSIIPRPSPHHMIMPLGAIQTSESDEMEGVGGVVARPPMMKKRFRTKFTREQKEKMLGFAERVGWKLQKQEESLVQQFCQEVGLKRRVLKVWMHNNKHNNLAMKNTIQLGVTD